MIQCTSCGITLLECYEVLNNIKVAIMTSVVQWSLFTTVLDIRDTPITFDEPFHLISWRQAKCKGVSLYTSL